MSPRLTHSSDSVERHILRFVEDEVVKLRPQLERRPKRLLGQRLAVPLRLDLVLDCALAAQALIVVSSDRELTSLNPWNGRLILTPKYASALARSPGDVAHAPHSDRSADWISTSRSVARDAPT